MHTEFRFLYKKRRERKEKEDGNGRLTASDHMEY